MVRDTDRDPLGHHFDRRIVPYRPTVTDPCKEGRGDGT